MRLSQTAMWKKHSKIEPENDPENGGQKCAQNGTRKTGI
jgi:hypothetical protein